MQGVVIGHRFHGPILVTERVKAVVKDYSVFVLYTIMVKFVDEFGTFKNF